MITREELAAIVRGLTPVLQEAVRAAGAEQAAAVAQVDRRLTAVETDRAFAPDLPGLRERLIRLEAVTAAAADVPGLVTTLRERVAVLEARPPVAGPPGPPGVDEVRTELVDHAHGYVAKFLRAGEVVGEVPLTTLYDAGVYKVGTSYVPGALCTWEGSLWICREATAAKPIDGAKAWRLAVKRGRDGRDGRDAPGAIREGAA